MTFDVPIRLGGGMNVRDGHWAQRAKRVKAERAAVSAFAPLPHVWHHLAKESVFFRVTLTRVAPRRMDSDGWVARAKGVRDEVARLMGIDDGDERLSWWYAQMKDVPGRYAVRIAVEAVDETSNLFVDSRWRNPVVAPRATARGTAGNSRGTDVPTRRHGNGGRQAK